jgi:hypothetical protein
MYIRNSNMPKLGVKQTPSKLKYGTNIWQSVFSTMEIMGSVPLVNKLFRVHSCIAFENILVCSFSSIQLVDNMTNGS